MRYAVPLLFVLMLLLLVYAATGAAFSQAWQQLLHPQFSKLDRWGMLTAVGHAFFSLGLGVGTMLMYGAYLQNDANIPKLAFAVVAIDTLAGVVGGLVRNNFV